MISSKRSAARCRVQSASKASRAGGHEFAELLGGLDDVGHAQLVLVK